MLGINADPVTIKQVEVEIIDRAFSEGWVKPVHPDGQDRQAGRRGRLRPGRPGRGPAAHPGRPRRGRVRAGRPHRRPAPLRHPRVQDGEAPPRPSPRPDAGRGHPVPGEHRTSASTSPPTSCGPTSTPSCWPAGPPRPGACPSRAPSSTASTRPWPTCRWPTGCSRATSTASPIDAAGKRVVIIGGGDTGADCLGTAHRQGAAVGAPVRDHAPAARRAGRDAPRGRCGR